MITRSATALSVICDHGGYGDDAADEGDAGDHDDETHEDEEKIHHRQGQKDQQTLSSKRAQRRLLGACVSLT